MNPEKLCPRYDRCSVNNCPLTTRYPNQVVCDLDKEKTCPMEKNVRERIAAQFPPGTLKHDGMTAREHSAFIRYGSLSLAVRTKMANEGRERLQKYRDSQQG
jgi:hypothetical protein